MQNANGRRMQRIRMGLALGALLIAQAAAMPADAHASGAADAVPCLWRVGILQISCLLNARYAGSQVAARVAAAHRCEQSMRARLQACRVRATAQPVFNKPPSSAALSAPPDSSSPNVTTDKFEYRPGDRITITGSGWQTGETVAMVLSVAPATHPAVHLSAVADEDGNFTNRSYTVQPGDAGGTLSLTATGPASGVTVQTAGFIDPPGS